MPLPPRSPSSPNLSRFTRPARVPLNLPPIAAARASAGVKRSPLIGNAPNQTPEPRNTPQLTNERQFADARITPPFPNVSIPAREPAHAQACVTPVRRRGLPVWISLSVGSVALLAAGYMGALVQLGANAGGASATPHVVQCAPAPSITLPQPAAATALPPTAAPEPESPPAAAAIASAPSSRPRARAKSIRSVRLGAPAPSSTTPAPKLEVEQSPVMTIRPLSSTESAAAPLSAASADASRPSRDEVMHGLAELRPRLVECAAGGHGLVDTHVTIAPNGRVTYSLIGGDFVGTPQGSCMARALRSATFPPFSGPSLKVLFPYSL